MREADMQTLFRGHLLKNPPKETEAYELKISKGGALPFDSLKDHQIEALLKAETEQGFFHKITDPPVFAGMNTKFNSKRPFDCFYLIRVKSFLVVWFYKPRTLKEFIKIPIKQFLWFKEKAKRKSLTKADALTIGTKVIIT